jgi:undecaprenyl-diphosphatase
MRTIPIALLATLAIATPAMAETDPHWQDKDIAILRAVNGAHSPVGDVAFGFLSNDVQLVTVPILAGFAASNGTFGTPLRAAESELTAAVLAAGLKYAVHRPRPYVTYPDLRLPLGPERLDSFPSGHAAISFAGATAIAIDQPAWAIPAYGWAALVCYSRLYNGVHYPTDVLGGAALGVGSAFLANWALGGLNARLGVSPAGPAAPTMPIAAFRTSF